MKGVRSARVYGMSRRYRAPRTHRTVNSPGAADAALRAVGYIRVSTEQQADSGLSLEAQRRSSSRKGSPWCFSPAGNRGLPRPRIHAGEAWHRPGSTQRLGVAKNLGHRSQAILARRFSSGATSIRSLRVGSAQSLAAAGAGLVELQQAGDWKAPQMPARYARHQLAARGAVASATRPVSRSAAVGGPSGTDARGFAPLRLRTPHPHRRPLDAPGRPPGPSGARTRARPPQRDGHALGSPAHAGIDPLMAKSEQFHGSRRSVSAAGGRRGSGPPPAPSRPAQ